MSDLFEKPEWVLEEMGKARQWMKEKGVIPTSIKRSVWLSKETGADVVLKLDCLLDSGSFKLRGVHNFLRAHILEHNSPPSVVISSSGGNHGMAVALACQQLSIPCIIYIPTNSAFPSRIRAIEAWGAKVVVEGAVWAEADEKARTLLQEKQGAVYIHPYADINVRLGAGTLLYESVDQLGYKPDLVIGSVGGGGLMSGNILTARSLEKTSFSGKGKTEFITVETEGADWLNVSVERGELSSIKVTSICKTLGASTSTPEIFEILSSESTPVRVQDAEAVHAMIEILQNEKILVEPSTACSVAGLLKVARSGQVQLAGKRILVILCGSGCIDLQEALQLEKSFSSEN